MQTDEDARFFMRSQYFVYASTFNTYRELHSRNFNTKRFSFEIAVLKASFIAVYCMIINGVHLFKFPTTKQCGRRLVYFSCLFTFSLSHRVVYLNIFIRVLSLAENIFSDCIRMALF